MASFNKDSLGNTIFVAVAVCLVCSVFVAMANVTLKPTHALNKELDQKENILRAAGLLPPGSDVAADGRGIQEIFQDFTVKAVNLDTGEYLDDFDMRGYDAVRMSKSPDNSRALSEDEDTVTIRRRENIGLVYLKEGADGTLEKLVIPVRGYGLWGTLFGYLAIDSDLTTVSGLGFYEHKETPGLGGEVDNPIWKDKWHGVQLFNDSGAPAVKLVKTRSPADSPAAVYEVDALSGATFTTRGVQNLVNFWTGELGYGPLINRLKTPS
ncbi:MAG: Na(+)-translocating NADH-quinone reductase subunit C [Gammaproteobacteria bacterium]|nr:Na(+)-translocating NADH-quinone reductase subunit C [Gammaproteobacteria bacterium]